jgi:drug/metabolite transporter (DMT)-like permease
MKPSISKGIIFALVTSIISGVSIFYNKYAAIQGMDSTIFNILKNGGVAIILSILLIPSRKIQLFKTITTKDWIKLVLIGLIGGSIPFILFFEGLKYVPAPTANLVQKTLFIWVAIMAVPFLKEKLSLLQILGYGVVIYVNFLFGGITPLKSSSGIFLILGATLLWAVENIIAKISLKTIDSTLLAWARMTLGVLFMIIFAVSQNKLGQLSLLTPTKLMPIVISIALLSSYVCSWYYALKHAPATMVSSILVLATLITTLLNSVFITHNFTQAQALSSLLLLLGVGVIILKSHKNLTSIEIQKI